MLPGHGWADPDDTMNPSIPNNLGNLSVGDILEIYKDDTELLKHILTAKAQEDKRRTAEELHLAEEARLQAKYLDMQFGHRRSVSSPDLLNEMNLTDGLGVSTTATTTLDISDDITIIDRWLSSLQARRPLEEPCESPVPSYHELEPARQQHQHEYQHDPVHHQPLHYQRHILPHPPVTVSPHAIHTRTHSDPLHTAAIKMSKDAGGFFAPPVSSTGTIPTPAPAPAPAPPSSSIPSKVPDPSDASSSSLEHHRVMEALRAKLLRSSSQLPRRPDTDPKSPASGIIILDMKSKNRRHSAPRKNH